MRHCGWLLVVLPLLLPTTAWAAASITGTVTAEGDPVQGASVFLGDTETRSGADGTYRIEEAPSGSQTLIVFKEGYRSITRSVNLPAEGTVTEDFELQVDLLYSDTVVVTGTRNPLTKKESSVSITTMELEQIKDREPQSTADLLKAVPGFYVESSGGNVGNNLWARGLPADGSYRYVALMEDGMPVYDSTELFFINADIFVRVDENVGEVEALRGGNAALFGSNAPGGVVNFLSRTGTSVPQTDANFTVGTDGYWRVGFNTRGPIGDDWRYSFGGFYRFDEGVRDPGYDAAKGGQLKLNLTRNFDRGYARVYLKYLDDRNVFFLPVPFQGGPEQDFVDGFPFDGTLHSPEGVNVRIPRPNEQGLLTLPLDDGQRQEGVTLMGEVSMQLGNGWLLEDTARYMDVDHSWNAIVPFDLTTPEAFAADFVPSGGSFEYSFTNHEEPFFTDNGLLLTAGQWLVEKPLENFSNQLQLSKQFSTGDTSHSFTIGTYFSQYEADQTWYFNDILTDVRSQPRYVDLTVFTAQGVPMDVTDNGFRRYGSLFVNADGNVDIFALFASDQIQLTDNLRLDLEARFEDNDFQQIEELTDTFNLGDPNTMADDAVSGGTGRNRIANQGFEEVAGSVGLNYSVSPNLAIFGRAGTGFKMPIADNYLFGGDNLEAETIDQVEGGIRLGTPKYGLNVTGFFLRIEDFPSQDARVVDGETVFVTDFVGEAETPGVEVEFITQPLRGLRIGVQGTLQNPEYTDFIEGGQDLSGNRIRRIPEVLYEISAGYSQGRWGVDGRYNYIGARWSNNDNTVNLPSYDVSTFSLFYDLSAETRLRVGVNNAFNSKGLTEGNPRLDESAAAQGLVFLARPILPRRITASLDFSF